MSKSKRIATCLWFDGQAEDAARFYTGIFPNSKILTTTRYTEAGRDAHHQKPGSVMTVEFELDGQPFTALNGGPEFKFNEAISFQVDCTSQKELDYYWDSLLEGGSAQQCGWLKDKFGVSWQVFPHKMVEMIRDRDTARSARVMEAMLKMVKIDIGELERAYAAR